MAPTDHEALVFGREHAFRAAGGIGAFAPDRADHGVAFAGFAALALADGFVVAGTDRRPGSEAVGRGEVGEVIADLDEDQRGRDLVDARDGL